MEINSNLAPISGVLPQTPLARAAETATTGEDATLLRPHRRESIFRLSVGWLMAIASIAGILGVAWDIQWHVEVGRDNFWTAPHWMIYSLVTLTGVAALAMVLFETVRYYRGSQSVTRKTTTPFLRIFHAPFGFYVVGFGILTEAIAAPLDDYWHQIYGIDVTIWASFHVMGIIGSLIAGVGLAFCFSSEYNRTGQRERAILAAGQKPKGETAFKIASLLGLAIALTFVIAQAMLLLIEALANFTFTFGDWRPVIYSSAIGLIILLPMIAGVIASGRIGIATTIALLFMALRWGVQMFVPGVTDWLVQFEGLSRRSGLFFRPPVMVYEAYPALIIVAGLLVDMAYGLVVLLWTRRQPKGAFKLFARDFSLNHPIAANSEKSTAFSGLARWVLSLWPALLIGLAGSVLIAAVERPFQYYYNTLSRMARFNSGSEYLNRIGPPPELLPSLPLILLGGAIAGAMGLYLGLSLRYNQK